MKQKSIKTTVRPMAVSEGAGVTVHRTIGTPALRFLDPFLMLDHFSSDNPDDYIAGFPNHPHRGFVTFTYMLAGHLQHRDSMGNQGDLRAGAAQWMKAASGIIHSEMPQQTNGLMRGFQLWINLPAKEKMTAPVYQEFAPDAFPVVEAQGAKVRVLIGDYNGTAAPVKDPHTHAQFLDVELAANTEFEQALNERFASFVYVFDGALELGSTPLPQHTFAAFGEGDVLKLRAGSSGGRFIFVAGQPIGEPVVQSGPFVMNTEQEIRQAFEDYKNGRLVQKKAEVVS